MQRDATKPDGDDPLWDLRRWLLASVAVIAMSVAVMLGTHGNGWRWGLFVWGFLVGLAGLAAIAVAFGAAARRGEFHGPRRDQMKHRLIIYGVGLPFFGAVAGGVSAGLKAPAVDWVLTAATVVSFGLGFLVAVIALRRAGREQI